MPDLLSCPTPKRWVDRPYPGLPQGTIWRCDCGVRWKAHEFRWSVYERLRGPRWAMKRHAHWLDTVGRHLGSLTPADRAWLEQHR